MKKIIRQVTATGADDSILPKDLIPIAKEYPFAEFGILISKNAVGTPRFPSRVWINELEKTKQECPELKLSLHLCGTWLKELFTEEKPEVLNNWLTTKCCIFDRIQLNFHGVKQPYIFNRTMTNLDKLGNKGYIFQLDGVNDNLLDIVRGRTVSVQGLFDTSHGAGWLPNSWPKPIDFVYCGYAGGLSADNLEAQLAKLSEIIDERKIWVDAETSLRSRLGAQFDLKKVKSYMLAAKDWVC